MVGFLPDRRIFRSVSKLWRRIGLVLDTIFGFRVAATVFGGTKPPPPTHNPPPNDGDAELVVVIVQSHHARYDHVTGPGCPWSSVWRREQVKVWARRGPAAGHHGGGCGIGPAGRAHTPPPPTTGGEGDTADQRPPMFREKCASLRDLYRARRDYNAKETESATPQELT